MSLMSVFIREQQRYTKKDLKSIFNCDTQEITILIKKLKAFGVLKSVKKTDYQYSLSDLVYSDTEIIDDDENSDYCFYVFIYVGVIVCGDTVIKIYPKYILDKNAEPLHEMRQVIKVLEKYNRDEQIINIYSGQGENKNINIIALMLFILRDYFEYGLYANQEEITEINSEGNILWEKTINESFTYISQNRPYYTELYTKKIVDDDFDYFTRLHSFIVTDCSNQIKSSQLDSLFDIETIEISESKLDNFGTREIILDRIYKELTIQFNTRKQLLLKAIYAYICLGKELNDGDYGLSMFGTNSFNLVWEKMCAAVFDNRLNCEIDELGLSLNKKYNSKKLIDVIQKPEWHRGGVIKQAHETLTPDIVSFYKKDNKRIFIIFDAKYYNIRVEQNILEGNPGISDITKQYLYQLAFKSITDEFDDVKNCFLMPTELDSVIDYGTARLEMLSSLDLKDIQVRLLPAKLISRYFLENKKIDLDILKL